jgi:hypothetical protein
LGELISGSCRASKAIEEDLLGGRYRLRGSTEGNPVSRHVAEGAIPARQQDDLHPRRSLCQDLDHRIEPTIVRIDQRIVED